MRSRLTIAALALACLVAVVALFAVAQDASSTDVEVPSDFYGVDGHVLRQMAGDGQLELLDRQLDGLDALDISFVRANMDWLQLEPTAPGADGHEYDFATHDDWVEALARHELSWYVIGFGTPRWAADPAAWAEGCSIFSPPRDQADLGSVMAALAERYGSGGDFWRLHPELPYRPIVDYEVWNEPNLGGAWCPTPDPARYGELVATASAAVRAADQEGRIVAGGLAPIFEDTPATASRRAALSATGFIESMNLAPETVDALGVHAYGEPDVVPRQVASVRRALEDAGLGSLPLSVNETGWTTSGSGGFVPVTEAERTLYMEEVTQALARSDCEIINLAPHTWVTEEIDPRDQEHWFGIADPETGVPYPSALAYRDAIGDTPAGSLVPEGDVQSLCAD